MGKTFLSVSFLMFTLLVSQASHGLNFKDLGRLNFLADDQSLEQGQVLFGAQIADLTNKANFEATMAASHLLPLDYLDQANESLRRQSLPKGDERLVKKIMLLKTVFRLQTSMEELLKLHLEQFSTTQKAMGFKYDLRCTNDCPVQLRVPYLFLSINVSVTLQTQFNEINSNDPSRHAMAASLGLEKASHELRVFGKDWSNIFTESQAVTYFIPRGPHTTDVVSFQILSIKENSYDRVPGLDGIVKSEIKTQTSTMVNFLRNLVGSRNPASSSSDEDLYQQTGLQLTDSKGDEALIERAQKAEKGILKALTPWKHSAGNPWTPEPWELQDPSTEPYIDLVDPKQPSIQGRENPLKINGLEIAIGQVIEEEALAHQITPSIGSFHEWSKESMQKFKTKSIYINMPKVLLALCLGFADHFLKTENEASLRDWILSQPYNSITLPELFRQSYRLNNGNVYLTLLTIENVLASNWRYAQRESLPTTRRLRPISSGYNYDSDRYGTWYHLFGMILFGYTMNGQKAKRVGQIEALGSNVLSGFRENQTQKQWMNKQGGYVGEKIRELVHTGNWSLIEFSAKNLQEESFLNKDEDFRDRLEFKLSKEIHINAILDGPSLVTISLKSLRQSLRQCRIDLIFDVGSGFNSSYKASFDGEDLIVGKNTVLKTKQRPPRAVRVFVFNCEGQSEQQVFEVPVRGMS